MNYPYYGPGPDVQGDRLLSACSLEHLCLIGIAIRDLSSRVGDPDRTTEDDHRMRTAAAFLKEFGIDPGWEPVPLKSERR